MSKGISKLAGNSNIAAVKSALSNLDKCVSELADLADACEGPAVMAISMVPNVGSVVGFVCAQAANMVAKFRSVQDRVTSGLAIANSISTAAVDVRFAQLKFSVGGAVKQVAKTADKAGNAVAKTATNTAATVAKVADKAVTAVVKTATTVGKVLASLGNPIDMALEQVLILAAHHQSPLSSLIACTAGWLAHAQRAHEVCRVHAASRKRAEETRWKTQQGYCSFRARQFEILHE